MEQKWHLKSVFFFFKKRKTLEMKHRRKSVESLRGQSAANMQGGVFIRATLTGAPLLQ